MSDPNTRRILSIDGGGMRGTFSVEWMDKFVNLWGIPPNEIWKEFDVICGTSAGGLQVLGYGGGLSPADLMEFLENEGPWIFSTSSIIPGVRANLLDKLATMILGGSFYPNANFIAALDGLFGNLDMQKLNANTLITSYNDNTNTPVLFCNKTFPQSSGANELIKNVGLATSAAPLYFPPANWDGINFRDGACIKNNPALLGYMLANIVKPNANRTCILSIGSGLGDIGFEQPSVTPPPPDESNMAYLFRLLSVLITGAQETDALLLENLDQYSLQNVYSYRANAQLDPDLDTELDNTTPEFIAYMKDLATTTFNNDLVKISDFLAHLTL